MIKNLSGIYYIKNKVNGKIYIGSSKNVFARKIQHYSELRGNYHHNKYLQHSWNKYGELNFEFGVLEYVDVDKLFETEQTYIDKYYDDCLNCYNINKTASCPPTKTKICGVYGLDGKLIKIFSSIRECAEHLGVDESHVCHSSGDSNKTISRKYRIMTYDSVDDVLNFIKVKDDCFIYLLDDEYKILEIFTNAKECCEKINGKYSRVECNKITQSLYLCYEYNSHKLVYKKDYQMYINLYAHKPKICKYILKFDYKVNLIDIINNNYGSKNSSKNWYNNCKINTRIRLLGRQTPLRVFKKQYIYLKSDEIIYNITTNVKSFVILDMETNKEYEFVNQIDVLKFLNISKSKCEKIINTSNVINHKYVLVSKTY